MKIKSCSSYRPKYPLLVAGALGLASSTLASCCCQTCKGHGYVQLMGGSAPLPCMSPDDLITRCPECEATGNPLGMGEEKAKAAVDRKALEVIRIY